MISLLLTACELGLIYSLVAMGIYLSFRVINFPDLTVDGTFALGAAVAAVMITSSVNPWLATLAALIAGALFGGITAILHTRFGIMELLCGILTMTALYSINLRIMGKPNITIGESTIFFSDQLLTLALIACATYLGLTAFLRSRIGLAMRASGANPKVASAFGVSVKNMQLLGLMISNGMVALAGALFAQAAGFADISVGLGTLIVGLAAVMIAEAMVHSSKVPFALAACIIGSVFYRVVVAFALDAHVIGLRATDLNLITAVLVGIALILPRLRKRLRTKSPV